MRPRLVVAAVLAAGALALLGPAATATETRSAWWNRANAGLLPSFGPPDVGEGQVLVEGVSDSEDGWTAVTAVAFTLDGAVSDATLTLVASSTLPGSAAPFACPLDAGFSPVAGGPWSDVPDHTCERAVAGEVTADGARVIFGGLAALAAGGELRVLIVPGGPGRFVFAAPSEGSVVVSHASISGPDTVVPLPVPSADEPSSFLPFPSLTPAPTDLGGAAPPRPAGVPGPEPGATRTFSSYLPPADDGGSRAMTAVVIGLLLGGFSVMQRGATSRLRPAQVKWHVDHVQS